MKRMIFATGNENKMVEIREILGDLPLEILSMKQAGIRADIEENGTSFEENALIKAREVCRLAGEMVLADDSGLEIDYLNGEPGIYSARYMGENTSYRVKNKNLMERLEGVLERKENSAVRMRHCGCFPGRKRTGGKRNCGRYHRIRRAGRKRLWLRPYFLSSRAWTDYCRTSA